MSRLLVLTLTLLGLLAADAQAQSYWFGVPEVEMVVRIRPDASAQIEYAFRFANEPGAHAIDIVDVGMPTDDYDLNTMTAWANGDLGPTIQHSTYVTPGVEIHLGRHTIHAGNEGEVKLRFTHPDLVFNDTTDSDLASFQITPTWFGSQYVTGTTDLKLLIFLPEGVAPDDVLHQGQREFANKAITDEGTAVLFRWERTTFTHAHTVGISFPIASMDRVVRISKWALLVQAVDGSSTTKAWMTLLVLALMTFTFFRFSGGTGFVVYVFALGATAFAVLSSAEILLLSLPVAIALPIANEVLLRKRKSRYLPPIAEIEGGGIKRGLTAPEAAVLLEEPLGKVLTLVVFGMLKKELLAQTSASPLIVEVVGRYDMARLAKKKRPYERRTRARKNGIALRPYEEEFLQRIEQATKGVPLRDLDFSPELKLMVEMTADRLSGFDLSDTKDYYRSIIDRALREAESAVDLEAGPTEAMDRNLEWLLLRDGVGDLFDRTHYRPPWHRHHHHDHGGGISLPDAAPSPDGGGGGWSPTLGDAAASYAGWAENTFGDLAGAILPGEVGAKGGGFMDLSGVDRVTGDILEAMAENSGSGGGGGYSGGGGSSCACACAGCACACACAGGGR